MAGRRVRVAGKFVWLGDEKFLIRGVTYGTFRPAADGCEFPDKTTVTRDFAQMAANGLNAVRTYTPPPRWLLDLAQQHGLHVMAGVPIERFAAFLDYQECVRSMETLVRETVRS